MRTVCLVLGLLMVAAGALWALQGFGVVTWPKESFMVSQIQWAYYGGATILGGLALIVLTRR